MRKVMADRAAGWVGYVAEGQGYHAAATMGGLGWVWYPTRKEAREDQRHGYITRILRVTAKVTADPAILGGIEFDVMLCSTAAGAITAYGGRVA